MSDEQAPNAGEEYALKEYFIKYMEEIKGLSEASIKHYMGALDTVISRYLKEKGLVNHSIFEIKSLKDFSYSTSSFRFQTIKVVLAFGESITF